MQRNAFGTSLKFGDSIEVLAKASDWFEKTLNVKLVKYFFCGEIEERDAHWITDKDLNCCSICKRELYRVKFDVRGDEPVKKYEQMKHLVFLDSSGGEHYTCYGLNWCLKRVGEEPSQKAVKALGLNRLLSVPTFEEFHDFSFVDFAYDADGSNVSNYSSVIEATRQSYNSRVRPLLAKWMHVEIDKTNVLKFISDWSKISDHLLYYEDRGKTLFLKKLYRFLGIYQE